MTDETDETKVVGDVDDVETVEPPKDPTVRAPASKHLLGVPGATALIIGGVIGTGVFTLPSTLAPYGMLAIVGLLVVTGGAISVGLLFARLSRIIPRAGGPYAYPQDVFGDFAGFTSAWSYWLTTAIGNAGIVVSWVFYVDVLFGWNEPDKVRDFLIALVGLWVPVMINLIGLESVRRFQVVTVIVKVMPLIFMGTVGLVIAFSRAEFPAWNPSGGSPWGVITITGALVLFIYLGVEDASSAAGRCANPRRTVPRATIIGTLVCAVLYVSSTIAIFGLVSGPDLESTGAPFSAAMNSIVGSGSWAGQLIAFFAVVSGIGALNGLTLLVAEVPRAAAADGIFPRVFTKLSKRDAPWVGLLVAAVLATAIVVISGIGQSGLEVFNTLVLLTGITSALPYFLSAMASLYLLIAYGRKPNPFAFFRNMAVTLIAAAFSIWVIAGSGAKAMSSAFLLILLGYIVFAVDRGRRRHRAAAAGEAPPTTVG